MKTALILLAHMPLFAIVSPFPPTVTVIEPGTPNKQTVINVAKASADANGIGYALLFTPGTYNGLSIDIGQFGSIMGTGETPDLTEISNVDCLSTGYWRSAENFQTSPDTNQMTWNSSKASPMRNIILDGNLGLSLSNLNDDPLFASSSFIANTQINNGVILAGLEVNAKKQTCLRNVSVDIDPSLAGWKGGKWNQIFVGCTGLTSIQQLKCGNCNAADNDQIYNEKSIRFCSYLCALNRDRFDIGAPPAVTLCNGMAYTIETTTPRIAEKPFITTIGSDFYLSVPPEKFNTIGAGFEAENRLIPFSDVYIASPDNPDGINRAINNGYNIILTPGVYHLTAPLQIIDSNTTVLGIGFPTLIAPPSKPAILVDSDLSNVRVGGIIIEKDTDDLTLTPYLLKWGALNQQTDAESGYLYDCTIKLTAKQTNKQPVITAMMFLASNNIVCDNVWVWRDVNTETPKETEYTFNLFGAQMIGNSIIAYGLGADNAFHNLLEWYGDEGQCYSFQGIFPPDQRGATMSIPPAYDTYAWTGYRVPAEKEFNLTSHKAVGVSVYCNFKSKLWPDYGMTNPLGQNIQFINSMTRWLGGNGGIKNVMSQFSGINPDAGPLLDPIGKVLKAYPGPSFVCKYSGELTGKPAQSSKESR